MTGMEKNPIQEEDEKAKADRKQSGCAYCKTRDRDTTEFYRIQIKSD